MTTISRESFPLRGATSTASPSYALPVLDQVSSKFTGKTLTAGVDFVIPAGAVGTVVEIQLPYGQILGNYGRVGALNDSSFAFGGAAATTFTTQVQFVPNFSGNGGNASGLVAGQFFIDYETGTIYGKKADAGVTGTITADFWLPIFPDSLIDGTQKVQIVDALGNVVSVTGNKLDVNTTLGAGTALLGQIISALQTGVIYLGTTALTPKFAFANVPVSQTDYNLVTAVAGKKIRIVSWDVVTGGVATNLTFNSKGGGAGTAISPIYQNAANGGEVINFSPVGHMETSSGEALTCTTGAGSTSGVQLTYIEV
jgi:hypothetical protein